ncbi:MAG TPA: ribosome-binding factor A [Candidatus Paceibacterota bacterium]
MIKDKRKNRLTDHLRDLAAKFLERESSRTALITVTRAELSDNGKKMNLLISVYPPERQDQALDFAKRKMGDLRNFVASEMKTKTVPIFSVNLDLGEKNRQRMDELLASSR